MSTTVYCFLKYRPAPDGDGFVPDCPDELDVVLLADLPSVDWGLFVVEGNDAWKPETPVRDELIGLIESGKRYPPALALARQEILDVFGDNEPSPAELARSYATALRAHLGRQHESPYVIAPALTDEPELRIKGDWYWILEVSGTPPTARWVSDNWHIRKSDVSEFDLTGEQLKRLGYAGL